MSKKELLETLDEIESKISSYDLSVEDAYSKLYSCCSDFEYNRYNLGCLDDIFNDYIDEYTAEEMLKHEVEEGGLSRVYFFLGDVNPMACSLFRLNGYANLEEVHYDDIQDLIDEVRDRVGEDDEEEDDAVILPF